MDYLRFFVGYHRYAVPVEHVIEVMHLVAITPVPEQPPEQLGMVTLRGEMMPVIDLRRRLLEIQPVLDLTTPLIALRTGVGSLVIVVDQVDNVITLQDTVQERRGEVVDRIAYFEDTIVMILNVARLHPGAKHSPA